MGVVHFISHLLVHFKLSNSRQQKYDVVFIYYYASKHRLGEFMNELVKGMSQNYVFTYPPAILSGYMQILDLP